MSFKIAKTEVWATDIMNRPGTLARLLESVSKAGAKLEFGIARKVDENTSRVFLSPIKGAKQQKAAREAGLVPTNGMHTLRIEGPNRVGLGAELTQAVAEKGINLRGASGAAIGNKAVFYLAFESEADAKNALSVSKKQLSAKRKR